MIETEKQRRWWFATHPEYSGRRTGQGRNRGGFKKIPEKSMTKNQVWIGGEEDYKEGFNEGYRAIRRQQVPPDLDPADKSAYAQGVRHGAEAALEEREAEYQRWLDPLSMLLGIHPSYWLRKDLTKHDGPRPSNDHEAHHIIAWRHWRAQPARDVLKKFGIDINSAENGVWLHRTIHRPLSNSKANLDTVNHMLEKATSRPEALSILKEIKHLLSRGKFPP